ncbi:transglutaminase domain-containing protein [Myxococcaceae bacterium JPH2]|nr:transglutaminase domain-containing protein [Myxococcaceae bacterium JPH2]
MKTFAKWVLVGLGIATGLSFCGLRMVGRLSPPGSHVSLPGLSPEDPSEDLGRVLVPADTPPGRAVTYVWSVEELTPHRQQVAYGLSERLEAQLEATHHAYARRLRYRALGPGRFTYVAPPGCGTDMHCIYVELMRTSPGPVRALGERFAASIQARQLDAAQAAQLILGFVQRIRYEVPDDEPFGIVPPALVPAQNRGDCDSKAVLAVMLLRQVGIDAVLLYSDPLAHAAVGVGLPGSGARLKLGGRSYQYAEVTAEGWPPGMVPPRYNMLHLWKVLPLED